MPTWGTSLIHHTPSTGERSTSDGNALPISADLCCGVVDAAEGNTWYAASKEDSLKAGLSTAAEAIAAMQ